MENNLEKSLKKIKRWKLSGDSLYNELIQYSPEEDIDQLFLYLCDNFLLSYDEGRHIGSNLTELSDPITLISKYIVYPNKGNFIVIMYKILNYTNHKLTDEELAYLIQKGYDSEYQHSINIQPKIEELKKIYTRSQFAPKPSWVGVKDGENLSLLNTVENGEILDEVYLSKFVRNIAKENHPFLKNLSIKLDKDKIMDNTHVFGGIDHQDENSLNMLLGENNIPFIDAVTSFLSTHSQDKGVDIKGEPVRIFGPSNIRKERDCSTAPGGTGPCRMLECMCIQEDGSINKYNWFHSNCDECGKKIRDKSHAVRYPIDGGSWEGCYCCIRCLIDNRGIGEDEEEMTKIEALKINLEENGIMDRLMV